MAENLRLTEDDQVRVTEDSVNRVLENSSNTPRTMTIGDCLIGNSAATYSYAIAPKRPKQNE